MTTPKPPSLARATWLREPGLQTLFRVIAEAGGEARVAGGAVRNALLKEEVSEVDLATTLPPECVSDTCKAAGLAVHPTGLDHGTVTVVAGEKTYEVTTLRHDVETDGRRARVAFHDDWSADAHRRDFTMNALYCDARGKISDFTNGYRDILRKRVIFVGSPAKRIEEDYLRILRFFRFHARYGKGTPDAKGLRACKLHAKGLARLSAERLRQELLKLLVAPGAIPTLKLMARHGILKHVLPHTEEWRVLSRLPPDAVLRLAVLAAEPDDLKARLRLSNDEAKRIEQVLAAALVSPDLRPQERRAVLYRLGPALFRDVVHLSWAHSRAPLSDRRWRALLKLAGSWQAPKLPVTGHDLIAAGLPPGPELGHVLERLEDWWIAADFKPGKDELLQRMRNLRTKT